LQGGYKIGDRLLRPVRVVVSKGPPAELEDRRTQPPGAPTVDENPEP